MPERIAREFIISPGVLYEVRTRRER